MLTFGVVVLGVTERARAEEFWCAALDYHVRDDGSGGPEGNRFCTSTPATSTPSRGPAPPAGAPGPVRNR